MWRNVYMSVHLWCSITYWKHLTSVAFLRYNVIREWFTMLLAQVYFSRLFPSNFLVVHVNIFTRLHVFLANFMLLILTIYLNFLFGHVVLTNFQSRRYSFTKIFSWDIFKAKRNGWPKNYARIPVIHHVIFENTSCHWFEQFFLLEDSCVGRCVFTSSVREGYELIPFALNVSLTGSSGNHLFTRFSR